MGDLKRKLSQYIDRLNEEKKPDEHSKPSRVTEYEELMDTVRMVRSLKEPIYPEDNFADKIASMLEKENRKKDTLYTRNKRIRKIASAAAILAVFLSILFMQLLNNKDIVYAMEKAYKEIGAYHGIIIIEQLNQEGDSIRQATREVWADKENRYYVKELEGINEGIITINNGEKKWQINPGEQQVNIFSAFPDTYHFAFEIGKEVEDVKNAMDIKELGEDIIAGRETDKLQVKPQGGDAYLIWIDKETNLPLQKETAMQNAIQYRIRYEEITFTDDIPEAELSYSIPEGYTAAEDGQELVVNNLEEAMNILEFETGKDMSSPEGYTLERITVNTDEQKLNFYYKHGQETVKVTQERAEDTLKSDAAAILGKVNESSAEILQSVDIREGLTGFGSLLTEKSDLNSIRWQENGIEYTVMGNVTIDRLQKVTESLFHVKVQIPEQGKEEEGTMPQIEAPVNMDIEENEQKSVDAGHSPWRLDPVYVTQVFVSLLLSPEGITGDYPISYDSIEIIQNSGAEAVAEIKDENSPASKVYLKKLIRQDATGIWTAVGYDLSANETAAHLW